MTKPQVMKTTESSHGHVKESLSQLQSPLVKSFKILCQIGPR